MAKNIIDNSKEVQVASGHTMTRSTALVVRAPKQWGPAHSHQSGNVQHGNKGNAKWECSDPTAENIN